MKNDKLEGTYEVLENKIDDYINTHTRINFPERILTILKDGKTHSSSQIMRGCGFKSDGHMSTIISKMIRDGIVESKKCEHCDVTKVFGLSETYLNKTK